jgi:hypothetical protein
MLLNIDKPRKCATFHLQRCSYVPKPLGTVFKPVGELGRDGGWLEIDSEKDARDLTVREGPSYKFAVCPLCVRSRRA